MPDTHVAARPAAAPSAPADTVADLTARTRRREPPRPPSDLPGSTNRRPGSPSDDEILGLAPSSAGVRHAVPGEDAWQEEAHSPGTSGRQEAPRSRRPVEPGRSVEESLPGAVSEDQADAKSDPSTSGRPDRPSAPDDDARAAEPENLRAAFDANPELRQAWHEAHSYRESFATPEEARAATALLADLDRMDALFFSRRPEDHAALARAVAALDPAAFASLARAMSDLGTEAQRLRATGAENQPGREPADRAASQASPAQLEFFHAANAAAVRNVLDAIESQVERLLPEGVSKSARNRVVGEIYRELDSALQSNRQLALQMRDAFQSGAMDAAHQRAVVSLITSRARQALPGVAKRVLNEWASTVVAANDDRRSRQRAAESRVDIAGSGRAGHDAPRSMSPRDVDYARLSDSDILNL